jgi:archaellum component FlaF (FlaF/FlaG flagellin family)
MAMGLSVTVATGILVFSLVSALASVSFSLLNSAGAGIMLDRTLWVDFREHRWTVAVEVDSVVFSNPTTLRINVTNVGGVGISESKFKKVDVLVAYTAATTGVRVVEYLKYNPSGGVGTWSVSSVSTSGVAGESINPICPCPTAGKGVWDPGETLVIQAFLSQAADTTRKAAALVATPWGVYGYR